MVIRVEVPTIAGVPPIFLAAPITLKKEALLLFGYSKTTICISNAITPSTGIRRRLEPVVSVNAKIPAAPGLILAFSII